MSRDVVLELDNGKAEEGPEMTEDSRSASFAIGKCDQRLLSSCLPSAAQQFQKRSIKDSIPRKEQTIN